ncbi:MAG: hypothetical protein N4A54_13155 [Peptostreptococcaceae bacterium]|jgi:hypothetical protein|nr:hypothetical protein [Peptostreptococcaceae bacterium]
MNSLIAIKMNAQNATYELNGGLINASEQNSNSLNQANNAIGALSCKIENLCDRIINIKECSMYNLMKTQKIQALEIEIKNLNNQILDIQNRNLIAKENKEAKLKTKEEMKVDKASKADLNEIKLKKMSSLNKIKNDIKEKILA